MKSIIKVEISILFLFIFMSLEVSAAQNLTLEEQAKACLSKSEQTLVELTDVGFNIQRVNDSLNDAENLFDAQMILKEQKKAIDFSLVLPYCKELEDIKEIAFSSRDEFIALQKFYNESITPEMDSTVVDSIISEIENETANERYEKISPLVDKAYNEIVSVKTASTTLNLFYKSTTKGVKNFLYKNWMYIASFIVATVILFFIYRLTILKWFINKKINDLEMRKKTIEKLIQKTQKEYFNDGSIPEGAYNIKIKTFGDLIRDIDRQIPLLKEELAKLIRRKQASNELKKGKK